MASWQHADHDASADADYMRAAVADQFVLPKPIITTITKQAEISLTEKFVSIKKMNPSVNVHPFRIKASGQKNTLTHESSTQRDSNPTQATQVDEVRDSAEKKVGFYWTDKDEVLTLPTNDSTHSSTTSTLEDLAVASQDCSSTQLPALQVRPVTLM